MDKKATSPTGRKGAASTIRARSKPINAWAKEKPPWADSKNSVTGDA
jgi:hypothetical protein